MGLGEVVKVGLDDLFRECGNVIGFGGELGDTLC